MGGNGPGIYGEGCLCRDSDVPGIQHLLSTLQTPQIDSIPRPSPHISSSSSSSSSAFIPMQLFRPPYGGEPILVVASDRPALPE